MKKKLVHIKGEITDHSGGEGYYPYMGTAKRKDDQDREITIIKTYDGDINKSYNVNNFVSVLDDFGDEFSFVVEYEQKEGNGDNFEIIEVDMDKLKRDMRVFIDDSSFSWVSEFIRRYNAAQISIE